VRRIALIVNPFASGVTEAGLERVEEELRAAGEVTTLRTERPRHAVELAQEACGDGYDAIVGFSGDGGYNELLNGLENGTPVGFVPGGGTSVLPRTLGLPRQAVPAARQVADALAAGRTRRISLGRVNGVRFAFQAGIGFDAVVVRKVDALGRAADGRRPGDLAFLRAIVSAITESNGRFAPTLEIKGLGRAAFAVIANTDPQTFAGPLGLHFAPRARFELGLDVAAPIDVRAREVPRLFAASFLGRGFKRSGSLYGHDLDRVEIVCDAPLPLQADGEDLGDVTEALFEAERDAIGVLV
jgi:diacylglycerol kinase family enzyme